MDEFNNVEEPSLAAEVGKAVLISIIATTATVAFQVGLIYTLSKLAARAEAKQTKNNTKKK